MKHTKVARLFCCIILVVGFMLSGCVSQEAKEVIDDIDALGEITLDSLPDLQAVNEKYDSLNEDDKTDISNIDVLEAANQKYNELKCVDLNRRIEEACSNITADSLDALNTLLGEYEQISREDKARINNISMLQEAIILSQEMKADEIALEIYDTASRSPGYALSLLEDNYVYLSELQIKNCLQQIGRWGSVEQAETYLKTHLKSPSSYTRYSCSCGSAVFQDNGTYKVELELDYGAANSFNALVRDDVEIYVYFSIDIDRLYIQYTETEFSAYDRWRFASS